MDRDGVSESADATNETTRSGKSGYGRITEEELFRIVALARVPDWLDRTFWEIAGIAEANVKLRTQDRAQILCSIHNAHCSRKQDLRRPADFDPYEKARAKEEAKKFLKENPRTESLADFIERNQRSRNRG